MSLRGLSSEKPFSSLNGAGVQVLALGRQFVAFGIHPQTRKPYEWLEENPVDCDSENLPTITEFQARQFIAAIGTAPEMRLSRASPDKRQQSVKGQYGTLEAVRSAIEALPNPDLHYDDWIKIGLALKGSLPGDATRNLCARMVGAIRQGQSGLDREEMGRSDE